jgi:hypothetical protein
LSPQPADRTIDAGGGDAVSLTEGREIEGLSGLVMKNILSVNFRLARPEAYPGKGDKYLPKIIQDLANLQRKTQKDIHYDKGITVQKILQRQKSEPDSIDF